MDDELRTVLTKLTHGQKRLTQGLDGLRADLPEFRTTMVGRFKRVEDKLASLSGGMSVNMMAVSHQHGLRKAERENADQLTALVLKMEQQILRLETNVYKLKKAL